MAKTLNFNLSIKGNSVDAKSLFFFVDSNRFLKEDYKIFEN